MQVGPAVGACGAMCGRQQVMENGRENKKKMAVRLLLLAVGRRKGQQLGAGGASGRAGGWA